ncbi:MAG: HIT domain-containing protein [Calditrichaeota bacterium]|nr:MAG: HIT domain-containing protein [Calditrichota bacterium]MBL1206729.1 HIT domain-containing protein [Calditrichota bacterium]NOG46555.1 HIT domain-containing protein [Calditrichota bacterium]
MENMWAPWRMEYVSTTTKTKGCVFCNVVKDDDKTNHIVYRGKYCYVILNKFPYNNGHIMIVPFRHTNDLLELTDKEQAECNLLINKSILVLRKIFNPQAINMGMNMGKAAGAGIEEHIHYHLLPRWDGDTNFMPVIAGVKVISESLDATHEKMSKAFMDLMAGE